MVNPNPASPHQSIEGTSTLQRSSSTSSSGSTESSPNLPRKETWSTRRRTSASGIQAVEDEQSESRRESISSMRTSSAPLEGPVTYTPTTHRISKAKKGKRVHACEYKGCKKIFTRAEHRRRHELNHTEEAKFHCDRAGCQKAFHRPDLLQRHQERHELEAQTEVGNIGHRRHASEQSSASMAHSIIASASMTSPPMVSVQASSHGLSIPSLLHPQSSEGYGHGHTGSAFDFVPRAPFPMYTSSINASDDFIYSSPESSQSPLSDHYGFPHRNSISSSSSVVDFVPPHCASPLLNSTTSGWAPVLPPSALPSNCNPLDDDISAFSSALPYQYPSPSWTGMSGLSFNESWHQSRELSRATTVDWRFSTL